MNVLKDITKLHVQNCLDKFMTRSPPFFVCSIPFLKSAFAVVVIFLICTITYYTYYITYGIHTSVLTRVVFSFIAYSERKPIQLRSSGSDLLSVCSVSIINVNIATKAFSVAAATHRNMIPLREDLSKQLCNSTVILKHKFITFAYLHSSPVYPSVQVYAE